MIRATRACRVASVLLATAVFVATVSLVASAGVDLKDDRDPGDFKRYIQNFNGGVPAEVWTGIPVDTDTA